MEMFGFILAHDTIQILNGVVQFLNLKIKEKSVDIIGLKLCTSLKLDRV